MSEYTDKERLDVVIGQRWEVRFMHGGWWISTFMGRWISQAGHPTAREAIDSAMSSAGIEPRQRETVTMQELRDAYLGALVETSVDLVPMKSLYPDSAISALLRAATADDGSLKRIEDLTPPMQ
jgi:hypothetical protein